MWLTWFILGLTHLAVAWSTKTNFMKGCWFWPVVSLTTVCGQLAWMRLEGVRIFRDSIGHCADRTSRSRARLSLACPQFLRGAFRQVCIAYSPSPRASAVWASFPPGVCPSAAAPSAVSPHVSSLTLQWSCQKYGNKSFISFSLLINNV